MKDIIFYSQMMTGITFFLYVITALKVGFNPLKVLKHLKANGAYTGIQAVLYAVLLLGIVFTFLYSQKSEAKEFSYFEYTAIYAGLDYDVKSTPVFCYQGDVNDRLTSNVGLRQHLVSKNNISVLANYTHHSCALNKDKPTYDAVGLQLEWKFMR